MPGGHLRPNLNQTEPARHRNHLIPVRLPTAPAATPRMGGTSPGTPAAAQMLEALLGVRTLHPAQPRCQHGADQPGEDFRAGCPPCTPGAAPRGPRYVGSCPGSPQTPPPPPPAPAHHTERTVRGIFLPSNEQPYRREGWKKQTNDNSCCFNAKKGEDGC